MEYVVGLVLFFLVRTLLFYKIIILLLIKQKISKPTSIGLWHFLYCYKTLLSSFLTRLSRPSPFVPLSPHRLQPRWPPLPPRRRHDSRVGTWFAAPPRLSGLHSLASIAGTLVCLWIDMRHSFCFYHGTGFACILMWVIRFVPDMSLSGVESVCFFFESVDHVP